MDEYIQHRHMDEYAEANHPVRAIQYRWPRAFLRQWGPALLIMLTVFLFSATPGDDLPRFGLVDLLVKKGGHMAGYAVLALACLRGFDTGNKPTRALWLAFGLTLAYALTDELHQVFTPGRHPSLLDVGVDAAGAALAFTAAGVSSRLRRWVTVGRVNS